MSGPNQRDRGKERFWRQMLKRWRRSGSTIRDFCNAHRLSEPSFHAWRRTIAARDQEDAAPTRPEHDHRATRSSDGDPLFVPLRVAPVAAVLEVVLGNGRVVRVPGDFDAAALRQLLDVLDEVPSC